mmetsp:Transcript_8432/g.21738  ORF Transcript_8432/g.21738 Transcript_8432/m.21738 type:complete len:217 (+) Transcript_8432:1390-2040(+)
MPALLTKTFTGGRQASSRYLAKSITLEGSAKSTAKVSNVVAALAYPPEDLSRASRILCLVSLAPLSVLHKRMRWSAPLPKVNCISFSFAVAIASATAKPMPEDAPVTMQVKLPLPLPLPLPDASIGSEFGFGLDDTKWDQMRKTNHLSMWKRLSGCRIAHVLQNPHIATQLSPDWSSIGIAFHMTARMAAITTSPPDATTPMPLCIPFVPLVWVAM